MGSMTHKVAVTPPPIVQSSRLRREVAGCFPQAKFNEIGRYLDEAELIAFAQGAEAILVGRDPVTQAVLNGLPELKLVVKYGVGLDNVEEDALHRQGVALGWEAGVNRRSVAELTLGFMLGLCHNVFYTGGELKQGRWVKQGGVELRGRTVGIVGCGHVGKEVVRLLQPFGCRVLVRDLLDRSAFCREWGAAEAAFERVVREADILSLHVPLTDSTRSMIGADVLAAMPPGAFLINTSRGGVVDQAALKQALQLNRLSGAAVDVFANEPPDDLEFLGLPNLMATPHIGGNAREAVEAMARAALAHLKRYFQA